jgi:hypothetical protein
MEDQNGQLPWDQPDWLEQATAWIHDHLDAAGWQATGPVELVHQRPWSAFARVETDEGTAHFKAPAPPFKYEAAVTEALTRWRPDCTVRLLGVDRQRGWFLAADAGITLRLAAPSVEQLDHWLKLLPFYVEFQLQMVDHVPELLALGMVDRRLAKLPQQFNRLMEDVKELRVSLTPGLSPEDYRRLCELRPRVADMCQELAGYGLPETLTHEEVHDVNVLVNDGRYIFIDWSDSSISHPFFTMLVTLRAAAHRLKLPPDGPEMGRLRDAYLEPWTVFDTRERLSAALDLAYRLAMITRALAWQHGTGRLAKKHLEPYADYVPGWLREFLEADKPESASSREPAERPVT